MYNGWTKNQSEQESRRIGGEHIRKIQNLVGGAQATTLIAGVLTHGMTPLQEAVSLGRLLNNLQSDIQEPTCLSDVGREAAGVGLW
jgi:hypothetical protein